MQIIKPCWDDPDLKCEDCDFGGAYDPQKDEEYCPLDYLENKNDRSA